MRIKNVSFQEALTDISQHINTSGQHRNSFFFHRDNSFPTDIVLKEPGISIQRIAAITHPALLDYLKERNIAETIAKANCMEVHYTVNNKPYYAIGFENDCGGYELRSLYFKGCTSKDISSKTGNVQSETCYLFEGFMDYLSFLTIQNNHHQKHTSASIPVQLHNDVIVLNSLANLSKAKNTLAGYQSIAAFLDNDDAGQKAVRELKSTCKNVDDRSLSYRGFKDLNEYLCGKTMEQPAKKKSRGLKL